MLENAVQHPVHDDKNATHCKPILNTPTQSRVYILKTDEHTHTQQINLLLQRILFEDSPFYGVNKTGGNQVDVNDTSLICQGYYRAHSVDLSFLSALLIQIQSFIPRTVTLYELCITDPHAQVS